MRYCPDCNQTFPEGTKVCSYCQAALTEAEPDLREWVEAWYGPIRFKGLVQKALTDGKIENRDPPPAGAVAREAYFGPDQSAAVIVPKEKTRDAQKVLAELKREIPDAFPEGQL